MSCKLIIELCVFQLNPVWVSSLAITTGSNGSAVSEWGLTDFTLVTWECESHRSVQEQPVDWFYDINIILATELWPARPDDLGHEPGVQHLSHPPTRHPLVMLQKGSRAL